MYTTKIIEIGVELGFVIPEELMEKCDLQIGDEYNVEADEQKITITFLKNKTKPLMFGN